MYARRAGIAPPGKSYGCRCYKGMGKPYVIANPGHRQPPSQRAWLTIRRPLRSVFLLASWHSVALYNAGDRDGNSLYSQPCAARFMFRAVTDCICWARRPALEGMAGFEPATCWVVVPVSEINHPALPSSLPHFQLCYIPMNAGLSRLPYGLVTAF